MNHVPHRRPSRGVTGLALLLVAAAAGGAAARDLPRQAKAAPAIDRCASFGTGFRQVAGSDTCIRLSGSVEVGATLATGHGAGGVGAWMGGNARR